MVRYLKYIVLAIVALLLIMFAFANRERVTVSFDPFASAENAALALDAPMFLVVIVVAMLGVIAGACATWISQGRHRRAARQNRAEADKWRRQAETLKSAHPASSGSMLPRH